MSIKARLALLLGFLLAGLLIALLWLRHLERVELEHLTANERSTRAQLLNHWIDFTSRALPQLQRKLVPRLYGRAEADTFPVQYRANTAPTLKALATGANLEVAELNVVPDPTYVALNAALFRASVWSERWLPSGWGIHLVGDFARAEAKALASHKVPEPLSC